MFDWVLNTLLLCWVRMNNWVKVFKNGPNNICGEQPLKTWSEMVFLSRPYHFKFFTGCLPQILLGPFMNTLTQLFCLFLIPCKCVTYWNFDDIFSMRHCFKQFRLARKKNLIVKYYDLGWKHFAKTLTLRTAYLLQKCTSAKNNTFL